MLYCQGCGAGNTDDARFCNQCGGKIAAKGEPGGPIAVQERISEETLLGHGKETAKAIEEPRESAPPKRASRPSREPEAEPTPPPQSLDVSTISLSAIGVRSRGTAWGVFIGVVLLLVGLGAGGTWLAMRYNPAEPPPSEPDPLAGLDDEVLIGDAVPPGVDETPTDVVTGTPRPSDRSRPRERPPREPRPPREQTAPRETTGDERPVREQPAERDPSPSQPTREEGSENTPPARVPDTIPDDEEEESSGSEPDWDSMEDETDLEMDAYTTRVRNVIRTYYARRAQACFEHETRNNRSVRGTVVVGFQIQADGNISSAEVARNTTGSDSLGSCLARQVDSWRLPPPPEGEAPLAMQMPFSR